MELRDIVVGAETRRAAEEAVRRLDESLAKVRAITSRMNEVLAPQAALLREISNRMCLAVENSKLQELMERWRSHEALTNRIREVFKSIPKIEWPRFEPTLVDIGRLLQPRPIPVYLADVDTESVEEAEAEEEPRPRIGFVRYDD